MTRVMFAVVLGAAIAGGPAAAHHSYSAYDRNLVVRIEGALEAVEIVNPHSLLTVSTPEATYTLEWVAPAGLQRWGIAKDWLKVGDRVIATGNPHRDVVENGVVNLKTIQRPADGWTWPVR
jgi:hypothetical protein